MSVETPWPGRGLARELEHDAGLAERVLAAGHRVDAELAQPRLALRGGVDRAEDRVDRAVAGEVAADGLAVGRAELDASRAAGGARRPRRRTTRACTARSVVAELVGDERLEVHRA